MTHGVAHWGQPYRALQALQLLVYEYDALGAGTQLLAAGALFQPWEPLPHWRGERVPVTLGVGAHRFEWNAASPTVRLLRADDFNMRCAPADQPNATAVPRLHEQPLASPFAELPQIGARLRHHVRTPDKRARLDTLLARLEALRAAYDGEAEVKRGAEGFDNIDAARRSAGKLEQLLAVARATLAEAKTVVH